MFRIAMNIIKYLQAQGLGSRKQCQNWVKGGWIEIDGEIVGDTKAEVHLDGRRMLKLDEDTIPTVDLPHFYILLNKAPDTESGDTTDEEAPAEDADSDDKESANEDTVEDADADYSADVFNVDEINEIATYAADTTKTVADGMTQLLHEDFSNCTDNFGFSSKAEVKDGALVLTKIGRAHV